MLSVEKGKGFEGNLDGVFDGSVPVRRRIRKIRTPHCVTVGDVSPVGQTD